MSQFTFTPAEDLLVLNCVRAKSAQYLSAYGVEDADLVALMAKIESQFTPVVEVAPVATPVVEPEVVVETPEEKPAKAKKAKAEEAE
jgi:hypothetical protein